ncbi:MAG: histidine phosphatase family protein [Pseudomonadota bacterium]
MSDRPTADRLVLLRHPRPAAAPGLCYGRSDLPLGPSAADEIASALAQTPRGGAILTSPARRARALAEALGERDRLVPQVDPRLQELDFGAWEGRLWSEIDRAESDPWAADPQRLAPPGGETFAALYARVADALRTAPRGALIVTHAGPIRAAHMMFEGMSFDRAFAAAIPYATPMMLAPPERQST